MYAAHYPGAAQVAVIGVPILLYPLPALIAYINRRKHARAIMLLNLSFGWTFLGWVLALILACMPSDNVAQAPGACVKHRRSLDHPSMRPERLAGRASRVE